MDFRKKSLRGCQIWLPIDIKFGINRTSRLGVNCTQTNRLTERQAFGFIIVTDNRKLNNYEINWITQVKNCLNDIYINHDDENIFTSVKSVNIRISVM